MITTKVLKILKSIRFALKSDLLKSTRQIKIKHTTFEFFRRQGLHRTRWFYVKVFPLLASHQDSQRKWWWRAKPVPLSASPRQTHMALRLCSVYYHLQTPHWPVLRFPNTLLILFQFLSRIYMAEIFLNIHVYIILQEVYPISSLPLVSTPNACSLSFKIMDEDSL